MQRTNLVVRATVGAAWLGVGFGLAVAAQLAIGSAWEDVASYAFLGSWVQVVPCGLFAAVLLLSATCTVGALLWLLDGDRRPAPRALAVYAGTVVATWTGSVLVPAVACSFVVAVLAGIEVRTRRLGRWWLAVPCMLGFCFVELFAWGGMLFCVGC